MASISATCLFAACFIFLLIQTEGADSPLSCYSCGKLDQGCNDPVERKVLLKYIKDCLPIDTDCLKIRNPTEDDVASRRCGKKEECSHYKDCHACPGHLCNSSSNLMPSFIVIGVVSFAFGRYL